MSSNVNPLSSPFLDDKRWFKQHRGRHFRFRPAFPKEVPEGLAPAPYGYWVAVHQRPYGRPIKRLFGCISLLDANEPGEAYARAMFLQGNKNIDR